jgi:hypothetical protein
MSLMDKKKNFFFSKKCGQLSNLRCIKEDQELQISPLKISFHDDDSDEDEDSSISQYSSPSFEKGEIKELLRELCSESNAS